MPRILLCCMPFGPADWPHLGLSLLKAELAEAGIDCNVCYFSLLFAHRIGLSNYTLIAESEQSYRTLAGEWVFSPALFGAQSVKAGGYLSWARQKEPELFTQEFSTHLQAAQRQVEPFLQDCLEGIDWENYNLVGFSSNVQQQLPSLVLAKRIKEHWPEVAIIFGGHNVEGPMGLELLRRFDFVDYVCLGEGDKLLPMLVRRLRSERPLKGIVGLAYRRDGHAYCTPSGTEPFVDLDSLPFPDYDDFFEQHVAVCGDQGWRGDLPIETSRGCWWGERNQCTFCGSSQDWLCYRNKSPERALDEIEYLADRYQPRVLFVGDMTLPRDGKDLLSRVAERRSDLKLLYELRPGVHKAQLELLKQAGVDLVLIGIESLSTPLLRLMHKGTNSLANIQTLKWCRELGIKVRWNILYGFPLEQPDEYDRMAGLIPPLAHLQPPSFTTPINLLRFSPHFRQPDRFGFVNLRPSTAYAHVYPGLPETSLRNLARHFDFDYADGRDPATYITTTQRAVDSWREAAAASILTCVDDGERLRLFDTRPGSRKSALVLCGLERSLYLACDRQTRFKSLHHRFSEGIPIPGTLQRKLDSMVKGRLMISENQAYLSLAVNIGKHIKPDQRAGVSNDFCLALSHALMGTRPVNK